MLDPKAVFLGSGIEVGSGIHGLFGVTDGWAVVEVVGLPEGLLGELFLGCLFGEGVVLVLYGILVAFLVDLSDFVVSPGAPAVSAGAVVLIEV